MVRVKVGDDQALHRAIKLLDDPRPGRTHGIIGKTGIDDDPAIAVAQQPQIDVIQLKRQRHAQPKDTGSNLDQLTVSRRMSVGVVQGHRQTLVVRRANYHTGTD